MSIEATNRLRAKLGLKPLEVESGPKEGGPPNLIKDDLGEFLHKPAANAAEKAKQEKLRERLATTKQKREIQSSLAAVKTLGDGDDDDLNTAKWSNKFAQIQQEKRKAAERVCLNLFYIVKKYKLIFIYIHIHIYFLGKDVGSDG